MAMSKGRSVILTPNSPCFAYTLQALMPQFWQHSLSQQGGAVVWAVRAGSGLIEPLSHAEADEYLYGGEYDAVGDEQGDEQGKWSGD